MTQPIESVAIVGAGNMGSGIAQKTAQEMFQVQMVDREEQWVNRGKKIISDFLEEAIERRIFSQSQVEEIKGRISGVIGVENVDSETDLVIEAVFEDFNVKADVFQILDENCGDQTILASNTSSLSVNELSKATTRPDRFVGLHFFYHPAKNRLVEVIPADDSSEDTISRVVQYCKQLGKVVIVCKDKPGFVVNRFFVPWLNEACLLMEEGHGTPAQIDAVARKSFNIGMGPFALMNLTGPPIALHSTDYLAQQLNTPRYNGAQNLRNLVDNNAMWEISENEECEEVLASIIQERLLGAVFSISSQIVEEEICSMEDVDRGAKVGLRWALGPFELMNEFGIDEAYRMAKSYSELHSDESEFKLPQFLQIKAETENPWMFEFVDAEIKNGIATVNINRPEAMNALNGTVVEQLGALVDNLNEDTSIHTIVLEGAGKAFVAGADVKFFVDRLDENAFPKIYEFTAEGHNVLAKIENSPKTTVALTTGLALGGGLELALSCDYRIGTRRTQFRFPETSIGIYPGLGGTQRTTRICGVNAARWAILAGNWIGPKQGEDLGLITHLVEPADVEKTIEIISNQGKPANKYTGAPIRMSEAVQAAIEFYSDDNMNSIMTGQIPEGSLEGYASRQIKQISRTAPIALRMASDLIDIAASTNLEEGLAAELQHLEDIFATKDAYEGLSSLIQGRRPNYNNE
ncbi:MAG: 3-hydroxyacyl-CoA dehydrogenase/enoyl-CoA hydratase family protein [Euryarchaeota archaeon TMED85]|nr:MAG: 3-hydroxyacyl-CoA dehydrogenase/enoyl-CoA hydratase family protein [Euryarchaeota archaeon]RPG75428.1 MAG: 3-hydroxyacyl-CoA dehydrogenase/enoyl-CoA hydratase family protein [Euryarchaeota archaeon TMED85]